MEDREMIERHYRPSELAKILGISRATMHARLHDGTFAFVQLGDRQLIPESEVARVLEELRVETYRPRRRGRPALAA